MDRLLRPAATVCFLQWLVRRHAFGRRFQVTRSVVWLVAGAIFWPFGLNARPINLFREPPSHQCRAFRLGTLPIGPTRADFRSEGFKYSGSHKVGSLQHVLLL